MDKELLARKLYSERVSALSGGKELDEEMLDTMWENRASPSEAAKALNSEESEGFNGPAWLNRYLTKR
ncbi:hypothetical protein VIOR3934_16366 [Vibrio orientalis CIP 102891 = ATCC 33934]|uniref:Uncharacterized protein n=1 Tax=Vibrio orientalis CIP 102891 = ATCC 33934 TaxID=675816 RepID=C9QIT0_VIBOR|nr:hypothetical protein [Vibrio orientalis]EEX92807.1 hypothetical protein VIA_003452 [Vibrio orientalis CIP 102891 = ATCC 33934]EGU52594.1 hypothetical protein VIOR3934_16366 [Vibrio orientalis CIP 102891 = ATCC 33934]